MVAALGADVVLAAVAVVVQHVAEFIDRSDLALATDKVRPRGDRGVLLSPFDPLLSDRGRTQLLFAFDQVFNLLLDLLLQAGR